MPRYLGPGAKQTCCLADALGMRVRLGVEAWATFLEPCDAAEATHLVIRTPGSTVVHHVMRIRARVGPVEAWAVESKLAIGAGRYAHTAAEGVSGFPLDPTDPVRARLGPAFPGYPGELVPCRRRGAGA